MTRKSVSDDFMPEEGDSAEPFGDLIDLSEEQLDAKLLKQQVLMVKLIEQPQNNLLPRRGGSVPVALHKGQGWSRGFSAISGVPTPTINELMKTKNLQGDVVEA